MEMKMRNLKQRCLAAVSAAVILAALALTGAALDDFSSARGVTLVSPPMYGFAITPNDGTDLPSITRSIWVGVGGDIVVIYAGNGTQVTLKNVPTGFRLSGRFSRVLSTNTTATNLIGEY
jgi:hypothetical protein